MSTGLTLEEYKNEKKYLRKKAMETSIESKLVEIKKLLNLAAFQFEEMGLEFDFEIKLKTNLPDVILDHLSPEN